MSFSGEVSAAWSDDGVHMVLLAPLMYGSRAGAAYIVPIGFTTDGASIPRFLWTAVGSPFTGTYRRAAVLHDYLYARLDTPKALADSLLLEAALSDGCDPRLAELIYAGVRLGGNDSYWADQQATMRTLDAADAAGRGYVKQ